MTIELLLVTFSMTYYYIGFQYLVNKHNDTMTHTIGGLAGYQHGRIIVRHSILAEVAKKGLLKWTMHLH